MTDTELKHLDAWLAGHVMGWKNVGGKKFRIQWKTQEGWIVFTGRKRLPMDYECDHPEAEMFAPTTNPADAMAVLKKCGVHELRMKTNQNGEWVVSKYEDIEPLWAKGETLELAIALFAKQLFTHADNAEHPFFGENIHRTISAFKALTTNKS